MSASKPGNRNWIVLREERGFRLLLAAGFISGVGDWFNTVAVLSVLLALTGSGIAVGLTLALRVLPRLVLGPVAGVLALATAGAGVGNATMSALLVRAIPNSVLGRFLRS